ncbi:PAS domain S-box protein [Methanosarcina sp. KYL-1]|uniref:histidine kinase dimerization/phosphoacceptor domain -containing protein n=1 Tax=Methanosarcina sp. KYL-1 TaxID=2602068 RepID=UPI002100A4FE|nr:histidine kinase dimerization/phosphoacceptor domain -containing protein [Methanosarcina sp. KYL-1]MCQ1535346.1 PAS domain S-box protein [Methanosarcina sp. KYL-1]
MHKEGVFRTKRASVKDEENELTWMKQLLSTSPAPVLRVGKDGTVLYANEAGVPLMEVWGTCTGKKLPSRIICFVRKALMEKSTLNFEVDEEERKYSLMFTPLGEEYVHIHGLETSSGKQEEEKLHVKDKQHEVLSRYGELSLSSAGIRELLDNAAAMVTSTLEVESCKILKYPQAGFFPSYDLPSGREPDLSAEVDETCPSREFEGGICIPVETQDSSRLLMTLQSLEPRDFAPEEVYFLRSVLDLVTKILECGKINQRLQNRVRFLETLLDTIPAPIYFKDRKWVLQGNEELFEGQTESFSKRNALRHSMLELEDVIPEGLTAIYKKKCGDISRENAGLLGVMPELSGPRESEEALKIVLEVQKVLWTIINNSPAVVFLWRNEENWPADFVSENVSQFGYAVEDFTSGKVLYGDIVHREDIDRVREGLDYCIEAGYESFKMEYRIFTRDGKMRWVDERTFIQRDSEGRATYFQGVVIDITERKVAEEALAKAEQLRKKEINHRIKNNLQIVSSLLDLQAEKFTDKKVAEAFLDSENRIVSMSLIHEELYESGDLDFLDFSSYIRKLIADLLKSYRLGSSNVRVNLEVGRVFLGVDTAISLGIIINELFTNSLKYAFPAGTGGKIHIALSRAKTNENGTSKPASIFESSRKGPLPEEEFTLIYEDSGVGFPEEIDFKNPGTLGLQLVNALVAQIEGSLGLERNEGTKFTIKFRVRPGEQTEKQMGGGGCQGHG